MIAPQAVASWHDIVAQIRAEWVALQLDDELGGLLEGGE